jgi:hypothetical protein
MKKETLFVSFSGGRTSAFMCWWLLKNMSHIYNFIFVFANTGLEHEKTLEFVNECDKRFGLNLVWLEAVVHFGERKGCTHRIVTFETASRKGEPFELVIDKYGIPNKAYPHCNRELKLNPIFSFKRSIGFASNHKMAIGIRVDEIDRIGPKSKEHGCIHPLIKLNPTTKAEVRHWWADQDFDLEVPEHLGNCVTCWKKSNRKLMTIAKQEPERFNFFRRMEKQYSTHGANDDSRVFFRGHNSVDDIFEAAKQPFQEFVDNMPELQLGLLDETNGCSDSCEAA